MNMPRILKIWLLPALLLLFASCTLASALWGCGFFFGKIALAEMNVGAMVLYRFAFATLALVPLLITHPPHFTSKEWRTLLLCAFLGIPLQFLIQFSGLSLTTVSHASLMVGTMPVFLAVAATLFAHERMDSTGWFALVVSTIGAALIALGARHATAANSPTLAGDLLVVLSLVIALGWILLIPLPGALLPGGLMTDDGILAMLGSLIILLSRRCYGRARGFEPRRPCRFCSHVFPVGRCIAKSAWCSRA